MGGGGGEEVWQHKVIWTENFTLTAPFSTLQSVNEHDFQINH